MQAVGPAIEKRHPESRFKFGEPSRGGWSTTVEISSSPEGVWALLGEGFADWDRWAPGIDRSTLQGPLEEGVRRVNETPSLGTVTQSLVRFDPSSRALAYEMTEGLPAFFQKVRNDWVVQEDGPERSRLVGKARFDLTDEAAPMKPKLEGKMGMALEVFANALKEEAERS